MTTPHLETPRVRFRPIDEENVLDLYQLLLKLGIETLPSRDNFESSFRAVDDSEVTVLQIETKKDGEVRGFASIREHSPAGHAKIGIFMDPHGIPVGVGAESMMLLVNYAFARWEDLRKVYALTTDASLMHFGSALFATPREATLPGHVYFRGQLWDLHYYSVSRESWAGTGAKLLTRMAGDRPRREDAGSVERGSAPVWTEVTDVRTAAGPGADGNAPGFARVGAAGHPAGGLPEHRPLPWTDGERVPPRLPSSPPDEKDTR
ncbi:GNAT family N-acetyltransferase [Nocardiopsis sp. NPDC101807]|uniref:GNAT family N-acetyltransferase n=1 Tax=Nocardiopsis sp. NPDC101807 TaxID=3364339 RepID=UPI003818FD4F